MLLGIKKLVFEVLIWLVLGGAIIPAITAIGPEAETMLYPVLTDQKSYVSRVGDKVIWTTEVNKRRHCKIADVTYHMVRRNNIVERAPIVVTNLSTAEDSASGVTLSTYPIGKFTLGPFEATIPRYFLNTENPKNSTLSVEGTIYYDCSMPWYTQQLFGPAVIPPAQ